MKNLVLKIVLLLFCSFSVYISYNVFMSFRYQNIIKNDHGTTNLSLSNDQVDNFPLIPDITNTTIPINAILAKYYLRDINTVSKGIELIKLSSKANPHIYYSEYLLAIYYLNVKLIDSAYFYSKNALYGWPKNLDHFKLFNRVLEIKKDTAEIFDTYKFINGVFDAGQEHHDIFIDSYTNAKLGYMIFEYKDAQPISKKSLYGKWQQVYEFEDGNISKIINLFRIDSNFFYSGSNNTKYKYTLENDTLNLFFTTNNKLINQIPLYYSPSYKTLIFKDIIRDVNSDNPEKQDQFFKKIDD